MAIFYFIHDDFLLILATIFSKSKADDRSMRVASPVSPLQMDNQPEVKVSGTFVDKLADICTEYPQIEDIYESKLGDQKVICVLGGSTAFSRKLITELSERIHRAGFQIPVVWGRNDWDMSPKPDKDQSNLTADWKKISLETVNLFERHPDMTGLSVLRFKDKPHAVVFVKCCQYRPTKRFPLLPFEDNIQGYPVVFRTGSFRPRVKTEIDVGQDVYVQFKEKQHSFTMGGVFENNGKFYGLTNYHCVFYKNKWCDNFEVYSANNRRVIGRVVPELSFLGNVDDSYRPIKFYSDRSIWSKAISGLSKESANWTGIDVAVIELTPEAIEVVKPAKCKKDRSKQLLNKICGSIQYYGRVEIPGETSSYYALKSIHDTTESKQEPVISLEEDGFYVSRKQIRQGQFSWITIRQEKPGEPVKIVNLNNHPIDLRFTDTEMFAFNQILFISDKLFGNIEFYLEEDGKEVSLTEHVDKLRDARNEHGFDNGNSGSIIYSNHENKACPVALFWGSTENCTDGVASPLDTVFGYLKRIWKEVKNEDFICNNELLYPSNLSSSSKPK